eukprot:COSAG01_NODE_20074_length_972_cov_1.483391_3_plen_42_part_01
MWRCLQILAQCGVAISNEGLVQKAVSRGFRYPLLAGRQHAVP